MRDSVEVSVITPVYNAVQYVSQAIESVVNQTYTSWELILVDDCSTDNSLEIIHQYISIDERIKIIRLDENSGAATARNTAIKAAKGRFIAFLDSDDLWLPDKLQRQVDFMLETGHAFTYTWYKKVTGDGQVVGEPIIPPERVSYHDLLKSNQIGCLTAMYDTKQLGKIYMPSLRARQDYGLWLSVLKRVDYAYGLKEVLALYRQSTSSVSSNKVKMLKYNWKLFREVERFSVIKSAYYLGWNIYRKLFC